MILETSHAWPSPCSLIHSLSTDLSISGSDNNDLIVSISLVIRKQVLADLSLLQLVVWNGASSSFNTGMPTLFDVIR